MFGRLAKLLFPKAATNNATAVSTRTGVKLDLSSSASVFDSRDIGLTDFGRHYKNLMGKDIQPDPDRIDEMQEALNFIASEALLSGDLNTKAFAVLGINEVDAKAYADARRKIQMIDVISMCYETMLLAKYDEEIAAAEKEKDAIKAKAAMDAIEKEKNAMIFAISKERKTKKDFSFDEDVSDAVAMLMSQKDKKPEQIAAALIKLKIADDESDGATKAKLYLNGAKQRKQEKPEREEKTISVLPKGIEDFRNKSAEEKEEVFFKLRLLAASKVQVLDSLMDAGLLLELIKYDGADSSVYSFMTALFLDSTASKKLIKLFFSDSGDLEKRLDGRLARENIQLALKKSREEVWWKLRDFLLIGDGIKDQKKLHNILSDITFLFDEAIFPSKFFKTELRIADAEDYHNLSRYMSDHGISDKDIPKDAKKIIASLSGLLDMPKAEEEAEQIDKDKIDKKADGEVGKAAPLLDEQKELKEKEEREVRKKIRIMKKNAKNKTQMIAEDIIESKEPAGIAGEKIKKDKKVIEGELESYKEKLKKKPMPLDEAGKAALKLFRKLPSDDSDKDINQADVNVVIDLLPKKEGMVPDDIKESDFIKMIGIYLSHHSKLEGFGEILALLKNPDPILERLLGFDSPRTTNRMSISKIDAAAGKDGLLSLVSMLADFGKDGLMDDLRKKEQVEAKKILALILGFFGRKKIGQERALREAEKLAHDVEELAKDPQYKQDKDVKQMLQDAQKIMDDARYNAANFEKMRSAVYKKIEPAWHSFEKILEFDRMKLRELNRGEYRGWLELSVGLTKMLPNPRYLPSFSPMFSFALPPYITKRSLLNLYKLNPDIFFSSKAITTSFFSVLLQDKAEFNVILSYINHAEGKYDSSHLASRSEWVKNIGVYDRFIKPVIEEESRKAWADLQDFIDGSSHKSAEETAQLYVLKITEVLTLFDNQLPSFVKRDELIKLLKYDIANLEDGRHQLISEFLEGPARNRVMAFLLEKGTRDKTLESDRLLILKNINEMLAVKRRDLFVEIKFFLAKDEDKRTPQEVNKLISDLLWWSDEKNFPSTSFDNGLLAEINKNEDIIKLCNSSSFADAVKFDLAFQRKMTELSAWRDTLLPGQGDGSVASMKKLILNIAEEIAAEARIEAEKIADEEAGVEEEELIKEKTAEKVEKVEKVEKEEKVETEEEKAEKEKEKAERKKEKAEREKEKEKVEKEKTEKENAEKEREAARLAKLGKKYQEKIEIWMSLRNRKGMSMEVITGLPIAVGDVRDFFKNNSFISLPPFVEKQHLEMLLSYYVDNGNKTEILSFFSDQKILDKLAEKEESSPDEDASFPRLTRRRAGRVLAAEIYSGAFPVGKLILFKDKEITRVVYRYFQEKNPDGLPDVYAALQAPWEEFEKEMAEKLKKIQKNNRDELKQGKPLSADLPGIRHLSPMACLFGYQLPDMIEKDHLLRVYRCQPELLMGGGDKAAKESRFLRLLPDNKAEVSVIVQALLKIEAEHEKNPLGVSKDAAREKIFNDLVKPLVDKEWQKEGEKAWNALQAFISADGKDTALYESMLSKVRWLFDNKLPIYVKQSELNKLLKYDLKHGNQLMGEFLDGWGTHRCLMLMSNDPELENNFAKELKKKRNAAVVELRNFLNQESGDLKEKVNDFNKYLTNVRWFFDETLLKGRAVDAHMLKTDILNASDVEKLEARYQSIAEPAKNAGMQLLNPKYVRARFIRAAGKLKLPETMTSSEKPKGSLAKKVEKLVDNASQKIKAPEVELFSIKRQVEQYARDIIQSIEDAVNLFKEISSIEMTKSKDEDVSEPSKANTDMGGSTHDVAKTFSSSQDEDQPMEEHGPSSNGQFHVLDALGGLRGTKAISAHSRYSPYSPANKFYDVSEDEGEGEGEKPPTPVKKVK